MISLRNIIVIHRMHSFRRMLVADCGRSCSQHCMHYDSSLACKVTVDDINSLFPLRYEVLIFGP